MNRACAGLVALVVVGLGAAPSSAGKPPPPRTVTVPYAAGVGIDCGRTHGCVVLVPRKGEGLVRFTVKDATGAQVYGTVTDRRRSSPQVFGDGEAFCGTASYPTRGRPVYVYFENHLGSWHHCPGAASRGVVRATFTSG